MKYLRKFNEGIFGFGKSKGCECSGYFAKDEIQLKIEDKLKSAGQYFQNWKVYKTTIDAGQVYEVNDQGAGFGIYILNDGRIILSEQGYGGMSNEHGERIKFKSVDGAINYGINLYSEKFKKSREEEAESYKKYQDENSQRINRVDREIDESKNNKR